MLCETYAEILEAISKARLNPYSNGICSVRSDIHTTNSRSKMVLILILMEYAL